MRLILFALACLAGSFLSSGYVLAKPPSLPDPPRVPDGLGINIHFTHPSPGEMAMLAESGVKWVRMDLIWDHTEKQKGTYDFSTYDHLLNELEKHGLRALFILVYGNPHYDGGRPPHSDEGRKAFARWALAAARHFRGRGILWEIWNEPNIGRFWPPRANPKDYVRLAREVTQAFRREVPDEWIMGAATSGIDLSFLKICFEAGLLDDWDAVSVHPYRMGRQPPETATAELVRLANLIERYRPKGKKIPILSGEWGYSTSPNRRYEVQQGKYLPRQWLNNMANGIPLSIWYDWHDDGPDLKEVEHNFGITRHVHHPAFQPKPAYQAAKTLTRILDGFSFEKRVNGIGPRNYVLVFRKGEETRLVAWTSSPITQRVKIPGVTQSFRRVNYLGEDLPKVHPSRKGFCLSLTDGPQYLIPQN